MSQKRIKVGDIFEIPLSNDRRAYGQYMFKDQKMGPLIQIFDLITEEEIGLDQLKDVQPLFPPVITGLFVAVRTGLWKIIGHIPIAKFVYPKFISTLYNEKTGAIGIWYLWDGERSVRLGHELLDEYKHLEFLVVWDPHDIAYRIETGKDPYDKLKRDSIIPGQAKRE